MLYHYRYKQFETDRQPMNFITTFSHGELGWRLYCFVLSTTMISRSAVTFVPPRCFHRARLRLRLPIFVLTSSSRRLFSRHTVGW